VVKKPISTLDSHYIIKNEDSLKTYIKMEYWIPIISEGILKTPIIPSTKRSPYGYSTIPVFLFLYKKGFLD
jgi:hypothetical protein